MFASEMTVIKPKVENTQSPVCNESGNSFSCSPSRSSEMDGSAKDAFSTEFEFEDDDIDDDLDTAIKEELDREVEEFARRLNSDWLSIGERQASSSYDEWEWFPPEIHRACSRRHR